MKEKVFDNGLIVKWGKSKVIFEADMKENKKHTKIFRFTEQGFKEFIDFIEFASIQSWALFTPKEATSEGSDYYEYYDKELDNNGYLSIGENYLQIERPTNESNRFYQFNKRKMESFLYDLQKRITA